MRRFFVFLEFCTLILVVACFFGILGLLAKPAITAWLDEISKIQNAEAVVTPTKEDVKAAGDCMDAQLILIEKIDKIEPEMFKWFDESLHLQLAQRISKKDMQSWYSASYLLYARSSGALFTLIGLLETSDVSYFLAVNNWGEQKELLKKMGNPHPKILRSLGCKDLRLEFFDRLFSSEGTHRLAGYIRYSWDRDEERLLVEKATQPSSKQNWIIDAEVFDPNIDGFFEFKGGMDEDLQIRLMEYIIEHDDPQKCWKYAGYRITSKRALELLAAASPQ